MPYTKAERLERFSRKSLLPNDLETKRLAVSIAELPTEGYPSNYLPKANENDGVTAEFIESRYHPKELICHTGKAGQISVFRKSFPHCLHGVMLVDNHNVDQVSIADYSTEDRRASFMAAQQFAILAEEKGLFPNISWTFDPYTRDRKSGQSQLWFHMHLNSFTLEDRRKINGSSRKLADVFAGETRREYVDEFSVIASYILRDYIVAKYPLLELVAIKPFGLNGIPNLSFKLESGWGQINTETFDDLITKLHHCYIDAYSKLRFVLFDGPSDWWVRPKMRNFTLKEIDSLAWLSNESKDILLNYISALKPSIVTDHLRDFQRDPKHQLTSYLYPLAGPSYAISLTHSADDDSLIVSFRPQLFSDTGAAGLIHVFETTVKLKRGQMTYSLERLREKERFEEELRHRIESD